MYLYSLTISHFGQIDTLQDLPWTMDITFALGGLVSAIVQVCRLFRAHIAQLVLKSGWNPQSFFAWRVQVISGRLAVSLISWIGSFCRVAITLTICVLDIRSKTVGRYESLYPWTITLSLALAMCIDVLNTCALCFSLYVKRDRRQT